MAATYVSLVCIGIRRMRLARRNPLASFVCQHSPSHQVTLLVALSLQERQAHGSHAAGATVTHGTEEEVYFQTSKLVSVKLIGLRLLWFSFG